jgi:hypothetical protein
MLALTVFLEANQVYYTAFLGDFLEPCLLGCLVIVMILKGKGEIGMDCRRMCVPQARRLDLNYLEFLKSRTVTRPFGEIHELSSLLTEKRLNNGNLSFKCLSYPGDLDLHLTIKLTQLQILGVQVSDLAHILGYRGHF